VHSIRVDRDPEATVVSASGELDAFVSSDLTGAFAEAAHDARIVADLTAVAFLDSTALGIVVRTVRDVEERGGAIRILLPEGTARRIFEITTLDRVLPVAASRAEAFSELDGGSES